MRVPLPLTVLLGFFCVFAFANAQAQDIRISEFLASNTNGIEDEDGSEEGWIEIWNASASATARTSLNNWRLTTDATGAIFWLFPAIEIAPNERIIVWASGKNRRLVTAPLHTDFTLTKAGGYLALRNASNSIVSQFNPYPAQQDNVSYGRDFAQSAQVGAYTNPSPGDANNYSGAGVSRHVLFSQASKAFTGTLPLTLTQETPDVDAVIRYTLNGSAPTTTSALYSAPINITSTTIVRARVFKTGLLPGEIESQCFLLLDGTTSGFSSPMPILAVTNFAAGQPPETGDQAAYAWLWEPAAPDNRARFTNPPTFVSRVAIDRRGSSTLNNPKYNVNFEARKERDDDDRDVSILGMAEGADYVLGGPYDFDRSMVHNPFIYAVSRSIGRYAPDTRLVEVFFDVGGGAVNYGSGLSGDYFGIYNLMEKIRRDPNRVDIHDLDPYDNDAVGKTGGYIWKVDRLDSGDSGFGAGGQSMAYYYPKEIEIKSPQRGPQVAYLSSYINSFNTALQSGTWNNPITGYAAWLDVPGAVDHHLLNVWPMNVDALRLSGYWHKERGGKLVPGPIWDFDRAMESTDNRDDYPAAWRGQNGDQGTDFFNYTWWDRLFFDINFYQKYIDRWQELRRGPFAAATVNALLDSLNAKMPAESINRDVARWGMTKRTTTFPGSPSPSYPGTQAGEIQRIKDWLQKRADFMNSQWVGPVTISPAEGNVAPGTQVTLTGPGGATIRYTTNGSDPRPTGGGAAGAGVLTYTGPITINATTRIRARAYNAAFTALTGTNNPPLVSKWGGRTDARYSTDALAGAGNLVVSEINYHPTNPTSGELAVNPLFEDSDFEFLELKNAGTVPIDLGGAQFTLGITFTFSGENAVTLQPGAVVILAANPVAFTARYPSAAPVVGPFGDELSNAGEQLILKAANSATILDFTYDDAWFPATDGVGYTLALYDPLAPNAAFSTAANWRQSATVKGSPGANEPNLAPIAKAGPDVSGNLTGISFGGTASDDRLPNPPNTLTASWSMQSGPGTANIAAPGSFATTASFSLPGAYVLRLTVDDSASSAFDEMTVFAKDTPAAWLARNPGIGGFEDDFDRDGRNNYGEFALGTDPTMPDASAVPTSVLENDHLTLTYTRIKPPSSVLYAIEVADAGVVFRAPNPGEVTEEILTDDGLWQTVKATDSVSATGQSPRFMRLRITPAP